MGTWRWKIPCDSSHGMTEGERMLSGYEMAWVVGGMVGLWVRGEDSTRGARSASPRVRHTVSVEGEVVTSLNT